MTGPVPNGQDEPLDADICRHQLMLLKSMHCARPVLYQGQHQFIKCLTANQSGSDIEMTVYLAGMKDGVNSTAVEIKREEKEHA